MDEKLILADGTELTGHVIATDSKLFVYVYGIDLQTLFNLLIDPEKTKKITAIRYGTESVFKGFKHLYAVTEENNDLTTAALRK